MDIQIKENETKGFAIAKIDGKTAGKMTYSKFSTTNIIIDHTEVEPEFKGQDVGKKLLMKIVETARERELKIMPLCPFAKAMFEKMSEIQDVLKK